MRTQIFFASTLYGAATLAAALDGGHFAHSDRRLLLVSNNAANPETTPYLDTMPGFERLRGRFDRVLSWNEAIRPFHPGGWSPRSDDVPMWERLRADAVGARRRRDRDSSWSPSRSNRPWPWPGCSRTRPSTSTPTA